MKHKESMNTFIKIGCACCCLCLVIWAAMAIFFPSVNTSVSGERKIPIYCVNTDKPQVALSFDAAWGNEDTQILLDILADNDVKTTFL